MPALADRDNFESAIVMALVPIFREQYERASGAGSGGSAGTVAGRSSYGPNSIPYAQFQADLQAAMADQLFRVYTAAGSALIIGQALVISNAAFEESARQWSARVAREIAASVVDTSQRMTGELYRLSMGDREKFNQGLQAVYLSPARLNAIAVTETTRAVSAGEHSVLFFFRQDKSVRLVEIWMTREEAPGIPLEEVCERCAPFDRRTSEVWGRWFPIGPPAHVGCYCFKAVMDAAEWARRAA